MIEHVYLTAPFRLEIRDIEDSRFACVTHAAGKLWQDGSMAFSPITLACPRLVVQRLS